MKMYLQQIADVFEDMGIKAAWHSFRNIPSDHCYGTYFVPSERFDGDDLNAQYCDYTVQACLFFRGYFDFANDTAITEQFESEVRGAGKFSKTSGYDADNDQFYSMYSFEFKEFIDQYNNRK